MNRTVLSLMPSFLALALTACSEPAIDMAIVDTALVVHDQPTLLGVELGAPAAGLKDKVTAKNPQFEVFADESSRLLVRKDWGANQRLLVEYYFDDGKVRSMSAKFSAANDNQNVPMKRYNELVEALTAHAAYTHSVGVANSQVFAYSKGTPRAAKVEVFRMLPRGEEMTSSVEFSIKL